MFNCRSKTDNRKMTVNKEAREKNEDKNRIKRVILDTNFLMMPFQFKVDIEKELNRLLDVKFEICVPKSVIKELEGLKKSKEIKTRKTANMALEYAKRFKIIDVDKKVDEALVELGMNKNNIIATNDKQILKKLRKVGANIVYLRQKKYLEFEGYI